MMVEGCGLFTPAGPAVTTVGGAPAREPPDSTKGCSYWSLTDSCCFCCQASAEQRRESV
jgi:hypothetical protein